MSRAAQGGEQILVVDDDPGIRVLISDFLGRHGYQVETAADAVEMDRALGRRAADLIVLDQMLPGENGLSICRRLGGPGGPAVIMLSAMGEETDRIVGLEVGADDYVAKPCNPRELLARVRAVLRRRRESPALADSLGAACEFAGWRLDLVRRDLTSPTGVAVNLSSGEFSLLRAFVEHPGRVLTRDVLIDRVWGTDYIGDTKTLDVHIKRLRSRIEADPARPVLITTIRGVGYRFEAPRR